MEITPGIGAFSFRKFGRKAVGAGRRFSRDRTYPVN